MNKKEIQDWIDSTELGGYIDCERELYGDAEFEFIINMAKELLNRLEE